MKSGLLCVILYFLLSGAVLAGTTVTSEFVITNRKIESYKFSSTDPTASFTDTGNGLFQMHDSFSDANFNVLLYGNQQIGFQRTPTSLFRIRMTGQRLGHSFEVSGKYANSSFRINAKNTGNYFNRNWNSGCSVMYADMSNDTFTINSSNNMSADCAGRTDDVNYGYPANGILNSRGISRDVYLDVGSLQNNKAYRDAPPDIYTGQGTFSGEWIANRVGDGYQIFYINKITIFKNPYFEGVTLQAGDNVFDVRTTGNEIHGNLVIPYVINGYFTPYNKITLNVTSLNGFKLKDTSSPDKKEIPYSLSTNTGSQRGYPVALNGVSQGAVIISNLPGESYALQGRFNADFTVDKSTAQAGEYSDTVTVVFQISL
ncbi:fimbrial protein [Salmonella enterica]|nr:fimbrial protein [Salmonella enterica subsp. diarizonae]EGV3636879.1 fimbrial protein [Salmonella enterica]EKL0444760.1 fimbrial protein [Salmonella enterica]HCM1889985.1 fimbrial protein [Salmonella enterica subsp. diarizonae serovar 57:c:z]